MKHVFFNGGETPEEIKRILLDNCAGTEQMQCLKQLSPDELTDFREGFCNNNLEIAEHKAVLKLAQEAYKVAAKPLTEDSKTMLKVLKTRHLEITGTVYQLPNFESGMMEYVNDAGDVVSSRRLKPEEKQGTIMQGMRKVG